ncbi:hypothetical protein [Thermanaerovibrio velox]|uniref:hypothetical protein n=1 Tax=Thermanaerovibrio velox TaxID=108007 RepID=UPI0012E9EF52|nr:hypothetical protein [Thermanaerovibrio velox]
MNYYELKDGIDTEKSPEKTEDITTAINDYIDVYFGMIDEIAAKINRERVLCDDVQTKQ